MTETLETLAVRLFDVGAVKIGDIEAKIGRRTPIYFDLRVVVSYPQIIISLVNLLQEFASEIDHDLICGVPYAALPLATILSVQTKIPMIMKRKENSSETAIEGVFMKKQKCLVVEDVVTSGGSLLETVRALRNEGLHVLNAVVVLDREQGGASVLKNHFMEIRSLFTLTNLIKILRDAGRLSDDTVDIVLEHIKQCQFGMKDNF